MSPTHSYVLLNQLRFHYLNWGGEGAPIVLLHGLASNARIWDFVAPRLVEAGFRVLALDQRSHGLTDPSNDGFDFPTITRDLHAFLETLSLERPLLVGHSWGANTVLQYAAARPAGPAGIVLVDGGVIARNEEPGMTWEKAAVLLRPPDLDGMPLSEFRERARSFLGALYSDALVDILVANFRVDEDERLYRRLPIPNHMLVARAIYEQRIFDLFARVRCPILLCPAADEPRDEAAAEFLALKRAGVQRAEQTAPRLQTCWFENTIHDIPLHRPVELARAIADFAQRVQSAD